VPFALCICPLIQEVSTNIYRAYGLLEAAPADDTLSCGQNTDVFNEPVDRSVKGRCTSR